MFESLFWQPCSMFWSLVRPFGWRRGRGLGLDFILNYCWKKSERFLNLLSVKRSIRMITSYRRQWISTWHDYWVLLRSREDWRWAHLRNWTESTALILSWLPLTTWWVGIRIHLPRHTSSWLTAKRRNLVSHKYFVTRYSKLISVYKKMSELEGARLLQS